MKPFNDLTPRGKLRRLRTLALRALEDYDFDVDDVRFLTVETNTMFTVRKTGGERFVLRIYSDEETTLRENRAEMFWLNAITRDTDIRITEPVLRRDGEAVTVVSVPGVPGERRCALFHWVPGRPLEEDLRPDYYASLGETMARLHEHADSLNPLPSDIRPKMWDKVFYYPDEPVIFRDPAYRQHFTTDRIAIMETVIARADALFAELFSDPGGLLLIHGDLHYWNVHVHRGQIYVIDFEDVMRGYPVQDVAVTLYYGRHRANYPALRAAYKDGYTRVRPWPAADERQLQTLMAARTVMFINYIARISDKPEEYLKGWFEGLKRYLGKHPWHEAKESA